MIAPDHHVGDIRAVNSGLVGQLSQAAIVIQAGHRGEITRIKVRCGSARDQCVGIGRVAHYQHLDIPAGNLVHRRPLRSENLSVGSDQVLALHARTTRAGANQQGIIRILECSFRDIRGHYIH